jgi:hypothetical protein
VRNVVCALLFCVKFKISLCMPRAILEYKRQNRQINSWTVSVTLVPLFGLEIKKVGIGLSYRPASLCSLATQFHNRFPESIPRPIAGLKGAQAWDIRERFFYTNQRLMVRWLWDWRKKLKFRKLESLF